MSKKTRPRGQNTYVPININDCGQADPAHTPISEDKDGGARFNIRYDLVLNFAPQNCPFVGGNGTFLSLSAGIRDVALKGGVAEMTYRYQMVPATNPNHTCKDKVLDEQFDVVIGS
jgi:hypothetical protein